MNFDQVMINAEDIITSNMKDTFLRTLDTAIKEWKNLDQFHDPIFLYVMQHKDDPRGLHGMVPFWLQQWAKIKDEDGFTPLHRAAYNHIEIARILIAAGADLDIQDENGKTAVQEARTLKIENILKKQQEKTGVKAIA